MIGPVRFGSSVGASKAGALIGGGAPAGLSCGALEAARVGGAPAPLEAAGRAGFGWRFGGRLTTSLVVPGRGVGATG